MEDEEFTVLEVHRQLDKVLLAATEAPGNLPQPQFRCRMSGIPVAPYDHVWVDETGFERPLLEGQFSQVLLTGLPAFHLRGEVNSDGEIGLGDPISLLLYLFDAGSATQAETIITQCPDRGDANDDGFIDLADPLYLLGYLFQEGPSPPLPFGVCGQDETPSSLAPCTSVACIED